MSSLVEMVEFVPVELVRVEGRFRQEKHTDEEIEELVKSTRSLGQINPITVDQDNVLLAGEGRLIAIKKLGWKQVLVRRMPWRAEDNKIKALMIERDENCVRKSFSPGELVRLTDEIMKLIQGGLIPKNPETPRARDQAIDMVGTSAGEYTRAKEVLASGDKEIIDKMEKGEIKSHEAQKQVREKTGRGPGRPPKPVAPESVYDRLGQKAPDHLKDVFADKTMVELGTMLDRACQIFKACSSWNKFIRASHLKELADLRNAIQDLAPHAVCPGCKGAGCSACEQNGWMPAWCYQDYITHQSPASEALAQALGN